MAQSGQRPGRRGGWAGRPLHWPRQGRRAALVCPPPAARPKSELFRSHVWYRDRGRKVSFNRLKLFESIERKRDNAFVRNLSPNVQALRGADGRAPRGEPVVLLQVCQQEEGQEAQEEKAPGALTPRRPRHPVPPPRGGGSGGRGQEDGGHASLGSRRPVARTPCHGRAQGGRGRGPPASVFRYR